MAIARQDLLDEHSQPGLEVLQLTSEDVRSSHIYMEAQIFTPDSGRFVLHRSAGPHGGSKDDPEHRYLLCDIEDGCSLHPLTDELGPTAPSVSPDGQWMYYFVDQTEIDGGRVILKRVKLDGTERQEIMAIESPLPGTRARPSRIYPLSTISSDGKRLALSHFLGDGVRDYATWGVLVFDLVQARVESIICGQSWCNVHPQYSRSLDAEHSHDILIQENHGNVCRPDGQCVTLVGGLGADIHVIRDDGTRFRDMPWGRDGKEQCQGHQCWRGRSTWAITSTSCTDGRQELIEGVEMPQSGHTGMTSPDAVRNDLSRDFEGPPRFCHFATDIDGRRLVTDCGPMDEGGKVYVAEFGEAGRDALRQWTYLLNARATVGTECHLHPFLSPDGTRAFFNSNESGTLQAYMIDGLPPVSGTVAG